MGLFSKKDSTLICTSCFKLINGIPGWPQNMLVIKAELHDDRITFFQSPIGQTASISLRLDQISDTGVYTDKEIIEKSKNVVGCAAVGSLFGPAGAIVGAISGVGTKQQTKVLHYYTITFTSSSGEPALLTFGTDCMACNQREFDQELRCRITISKPTRETSRFL